jgi:hypothetical protein
MQHPDLFLQHPSEDLQHISETSKTLETYACNMRFQQNLVGGRAEHCTAGSSFAVVVEKEDDSRRAVTRPLVRAAPPPGDRARAVPQRVVPAMEATTVVGWVRHCAARRQWLCGRRGARRDDGEEGMWESRVGRYFRER